MDAHYTLADYAYKYRSDVPISLTWGRARLTLTALGNETVACQFVVVPARDALFTLGTALHFDWQPGPRLRLAVGEFIAPSGQVVAGVVTANFVGLVPADRGNLFVADPLLHEEAIAVRGGCPQAVWLSFRLPAGAVPGRYILPLTLYSADADFADEQIVAQAEVAVDLYPLALPEPRDFRHHLDLWQHPTGLARGHGVPLWSEAHWSLIEAYGRELARLGQKVITLVASDAPWAGQSCRRETEYPSSLFEYNIVGLSRGRDGALHCDFSRLDRYVETYLRLGIDREIEIIGLLAAWDDEFGRPLRDHPDNVRLVCRDEATGALTWLRTKAELFEYLQALHTHLVGRGWWEKVRFTADEPSDVAAFRARLRFLQQACPGAKAKIPFGHIEFVDEFLTDVADWVPILPTYSGDTAKSQRLQAIVQQRGDRMLWYVCCGPARPNNFITSPAIEARFQGWFTAWAGLDGFLRWAFTCWPADPWGRPGYRFPGWPSGDMFFVYPGRDGQPVRSLRTETLLMGIQDYELLALARERARSEPTVAQALQQAFARTVRADLAAFAQVDATPPEVLYSLDPTDYEEARRLVIEAYLATQPPCSSL